MEKVKFGTIHVNNLTFNDALNEIEKLITEKKGGFVVTPNVDHIVLSEHNQSLRSAYGQAALSLADGKPLIWMSRLAGFPLHEKISGSDLIRPLMARAAEKNLSVYFLGSKPGVGLTAAMVLLNEIPTLRIVGIDSPPIGFDSDPELENRTLEKMLAAKPDIVLFALGAPKQELLMHKWYRNGINPVMLGIGASLDFISGRVKRAPKWMSDAGLEWLYRMLKDPGRLIKRYLGRDLAILPIFIKMLRKLY